MITNIRNYYRVGLYFTLSLQLKLAIGYPTVKLGLSYCTFLNLYIQIPILPIIKHIILFPIKIIDKTIIIYNDIALLQETILEINFYLYNEHDQISILGQKYCISYHCVHSNMCHRNIGDISFFLNSQFQATLQGTLPKVVSHNTNIWLYTIN